jgi:hypothetical protein
MTDVAVALAALLHDAPKAVQLHCMRRDVTERSTAEEPADKWTPSEGLQLRVKPQYIAGVMVANVHR